jgi:hypothetical protein
MYSFPNNRFISQRLRLVTWERHVRAICCHGNLGLCLLADVWLLAPLFRHSGVMSHCSLLKAVRRE